MAKKSVDLFAVAITQRSTADGQRSYLMVEISDSETSKGGQPKIIGDWGLQSELYNQLCEATVRGTTDTVVLEDDKRIVIEPVPVGLGWLVDDRSVPKLIQYRRREAGEQPSRRTLTSVSLVALVDLRENPQDLVDAEMIRRCLTDNADDCTDYVGTWYRPILGEDYSDYYVAECTWDDIRAELGFPPVSSTDVDDMVQDVQVVE